PARRGANDPTRRGADHSDAVGAHHRASNGGHHASRDADALSAYNRLGMWQWLLVMGGPGGAFLRAFLSRPLEPLRRSCLGLPRVARIGAWVGFLAIPGAALTAGANGAATVAATPFALLGLAAASDRAARAFLPVAVAGLVGALSLAVPNPLLLFFFAVP